MIKQYFRQQMRSLQYKHRKDVDEIVGLLKSYKCKDCHSLRESDIKEARYFPAEKMALALPLSMSLSTELENGTNGEGPQNPQSQSQQCLQQQQQQNGKLLSQISKVNQGEDIGCRLSLSRTPAILLTRAKLTLN